MGGIPLPSQEAHYNGLQEPEASDGKGRQLQVDWRVAIHTGSGAQPELTLSIRGQEEWQERRWRRLRRQQVVVAAATALPT